MSTLTERYIDEFVEDGCWKEPSRRKQLVRFELCPLFGLVSDFPSLLISQQPCLKLFSPSRKTPSSTLFLVLPKLWESLRLLVSFFSFERREGEGGRAEKEVELRPCRKIGSLLLQLELFSILELMRAKRGGLECML